MGQLKANLGTVVTVADQEKFAEEYSTTIKTVCGKHGLSWKRPFCRAADLGYFAGSEDTTTQIIEEILRLVESQIKQVNIVYTLIFSTNIQKVLIYGRDPPIESLSPLDFQDRLQNAYSYLCLWAYLRSLQGLRRSLISDNFSGEHTIAWQELQKGCAPKIFFDGANTNAIVSMADLLVRLLSTRLDRKTEKLSEILNMDRLPGFLPELDGRIQPFYLGQKFLKQIVPLNRRKIITDPYIAHPVLFVVKEPTSLQTADFISRTSVMDSIYDAAVRLGGCVKFFGQHSADQKLIQQGDYFLWIGEHGKRFVESLSSLGYTGLNIREAKEANRILGG